MLLVYDVEPGLALAWNNWQLFPCWDAEQFADFVVLLQFQHVANVRQLLNGTAKGT